MNPSEEELQLKQTLRTLGIQRIEEIKNQERDAFVDQNKFQSHLDDTSLEELSVWFYAIITDAADLPNTPFPTNNIRHAINCTSCLNNLAYAYINFEQQVETINSWSQITPFPKVNILIRNILYELTLGKNDVRILFNRIKNWLFKKIFNS